MIPLFLNELSLVDLETGGPCLGTKAEVFKVMEDVVLTLQAGEKKGLIKSFRLLPDCLLAELISGYSLTDWLNDRVVSREIRQYVRRKASMLPYLVPADLDVRVEGRSAMGLAAAYSDSGVVLSLMTADRWKELHVNAELDKCDQDGNLQSLLIHIGQVAHSEHWRKHGQEYRKRLVDASTDGQILLANAQAAFPAIEFCDKAPDQIRSLTGNERHFSWVKHSLLMLNEEVLDWSAGEFLHGRLPGPASGESASVHKDEKLRNLRLFTTLVGETLMFEHHMKNVSENQRVYYRFDPERIVASVGYVGEHLATALY